MFLDPEGQQIRTSMHAQHADVFRFAYELASQAHSLLQSASISSEDLQQLVLAPLAIRATTSFQGTVLLLERGLPTEAKILARSLLEALFRATAIAKGRHYAEAYVLEDQFFRRKIINKSKLLSPHLREKFEGEQTTQLAREIKADIEERELTEKTTQWWAGEAGLSDFYNTAYAVFSLSVHAASRDLEEHLRLNEMERIVAMQVGPSSAELELIAISACESLILTFEAAAAIFSESALNRLAELKAKLAQLNEVI
jgi:Family of unknown function (DUF5677)